MSIIGVLVYWSASTDATITNYKVYCGTSPGTYTDPSSPLTVGNVLHTYYSVPGPGLYYFAIAAVSSVTGETTKGTPFTITVAEPSGIVRSVMRRAAY